MEHDINNLKDISKRLVTNSGMNHRTIKQEIFSAMKELSDELPHIRVLYNKTYGGYGYSKEFCEYLASKHIEFEWFDRNNKDIRIEHVKYVEEFGKHCKETYPLIAEFIALYNKYALRYVFSIVTSLQCDESEIKRVNDALKLIEETDDSLFENEMSINNMLLYNLDINKLKVYDKAFLQGWLLGKRLEILERSKDSNNNLGNILESDLVDLIVGNSDVTFSDEDEPSTPWYKKKKWTEKSGNKLSFSDAIEEYGAQHFAVWKCQQYYTEKAMRFLLKYNTLFELDQIDKYCSDLEIGLLFASGPYCQLDVDEAPQILAWYIGEYDGLESIVVEP